MAIPASKIEPAAEFARTHQRQLDLIMQQHPALANASPPMPVSRSVPNADPCDLFAPVALDVANGSFRLRNPARRPEGLVGPFLGHGACLEPLMPASSTILRWYDVREPAQDGDLVLTALDWNLLYGVVQRGRDDPAWMAMYGAQPGPIASKILRHIDGQHMLLTNTSSVWLNGPGRHGFYRNRVLGTLRYILIDGKPAYGSGPYDCGWSELSEAFATLPADPSLHVIPKNTDIDALLTTNAPAEAGSDVTANHTAAAIANQGLLATEDFPELFRFTGDNSWPTSTTIAGADEYPFTSDLDGDCIVQVKARDAEGGARVGLNGTELGAMSGPNLAEQWYVFGAEDLLIAGSNNVQVWAATGDAGSVLAIQVQRVPAGANLSGLVDALNTTNGPAEAGADVTGNHSADVDALATIDGPAEPDSNVTETRFSIADLGPTGTFDPVWSGSSPQPAGLLSYAVSLDGREAMIWATNNHTGTSNSSSCSLSGVPAEARPSVIRNLSLLMTDSGLVTLARARVNTNGTIDFFRSNVSGSRINFGNNWTTSGQKGLPEGTRLRYQL